jgi:hypothetical protein
MTATLHPAHDPRAPITFLALDALAAHLIRQRAGRSVELTGAQVSIDGAALVQALSAYAIRPRDRTAFLDDPAAFDADWLGLIFAGPQAWTQLTAALARVRTAGGLAA